MTPLNPWFYNPSTVCRDLLYATNRVRFSKTHPGIIRADHIAVKTPVQRACRGPGWAILQTIDVACCMETALLAVMVALRSQSRILRLSVTSASTSWPPHRHPPRPAPGSLDDIQVSPTTGDVSVAKDGLEFDTPIPYLPAIRRGISFW